MYEHVFRAVVLPAYESPLRGRYTLEYLRQYAANQSLDRDALAALQWRSLRTLLRHCWDHVPFYRTHWASAIDDPADVRSIDDFRRLPPLERTHIAPRPDQLLASTSHGPLVFRQTDGTTAPPLHVAYSRVDYERRQALILRGYGWTGYQVGARAAYLWGEPATRARGMRGLRERLHHALFNRILLDATHLAEPDLARHAERLRTVRPRVLVGYSGALHALARWLLDTGREVPRPAVVLAAAEPLSPHQRAVVAEAFGAPVRDTYGCREFSLVAAEHQQCGRLHVNADHLLVETEPGPASGLERILVTDLANHAMPLVRYAIGDLGALSPRPCPCDLPFPSLERVVGRESESLKLPGGGTIHASRLVDAAGAVPAWRQIQFTQPVSGPVEVRVAAGSTLDDGAGARLLDALSQACRGALDFRLARVEQAPTAAGGKTPLVWRAA